MWQVYVGRIRKYVGAYLMKLNGKVDAIVVAGGAGEASFDLRQRIFSGMSVRSSPASGDCGLHATFLKYRQCTCDCNGQSSVMDSRCRLVGPAIVAT